MKLQKDYLDLLVKQGSLKCSTHRGLYTYKYLHAGVDFTNHYIRLARGLTVDEQGNVVLVGFEKFFCLNQLDAYSKYSDDFKEEFCHLQPVDAYICFEKLDGTMIIAGTYNGELVLSTSSSMCNDYTKIAERLLKEHLKESLPGFIRCLEEDQLCYVFEYISPDNKIGVSYDETKLVLLNVISKETLKPVFDYETFAFDTPEIFWLSYDRLLELQNKENFEGVVVTNNYGRMIKVKTYWWYENHVSDIWFSKHITKRMIKSVVDHFIDGTVEDIPVTDNTKQLIDSADHFIRDAQDLLVGVSSLKELYTTKMSPLLSLSAALFVGNPDNQKRVLENLLKKAFTNC